MSILSLQIWETNLNWVHVPIINSAGGKTKKISVKLCPWKRRG